MRRQIPHFRPALQTRFNRPLYFFFPGPWNRIDQFTCSWVSDLDRQFLRLFDM
jgi:hypothetical protein